MVDLKGKITIITGGSRGIGRACCLEFAKAGAQIVFTYNKSENEARKLEEEIKVLGAIGVGIKADIKDYSQCRQVVEKTLAQFSQLDILVNNAGITKDKALMMMSIDEWKEVVDTNLGGTFHMTRAAITTFLKQKKGCVINISSVSGITGLPRQTNYSASKAGIIGFSKSLAKEVAAYGVRVNVVCPGFIDTDMVNGLRDDFKKEMVNNIPQKRLGEAKEVAYLCAFLASDNASYITGEAIKIDGGLAI